MATENKYKIPFKRKTQDTDENNDRSPEKRATFNIADRFLKTPSQAAEVTNYGAAGKMMAKMGYQAGKGLGKFQQGRVEAVEMSKQKGRRGLGLSLGGFEPSDAEWDFDKDPVFIEETVVWLQGCIESAPSYDEMKSWPIVENSKLTIHDEAHFCDEQVLQDVINCKSIFDNLEGDEMQKARTRSNPYETIRGAFFLNRAAMKMANMDAVLDFMFTNPHDLEGNSLITPGDLLYFADVCAGPGGFSEYVIWRKKCEVKGFGFTLKGPNDFKLEDFYAASSEFFEPHYGVGGADGDGDIYKPSNLDEFRKFIFNNTNNLGVHMMMADGGFSVEGQENIQEILSKRLYLCQCLCALLILRQGGSFVCKLFDIFTPFSVGLVYLMYRAFDRVTLFKPVTSRPANSERYIICSGKRADADSVRQYLYDINCRMENLWTKNGAGRIDIQHIVPLDLLKEDETFYNYIVNSNNELGKLQAVALAKIQVFARNTNLIDMRQADTRTDCLKKWQIPDRVRTAPNWSEPPKSRYEFLTKLSSTSAAVQPKKLSSIVMQNIHSVYDYRCVLMAEKQGVILLGLGGSRVFKYDSTKSNWLKVDDPKLELPADTIVEAEFVFEYRGEGKAQRKVKAVHLIDAMFLCGTDVSHLHFADRIDKLIKFAKGINRTTRFDLAPIRVKEIFRLEEIENVISNKLEVKQMKGFAAPKQCFCCGQNTDRSDIYFLPCGVLFIKMVKSPWMMAFSNSQKRKYFFHTVDKKTDWNMPKGSIEDFLSCKTNEMLWSWEDSTVKNSEYLTSQELFSFIQDKTSH